MGARPLAEIIDKNLPTIESSVNYWLIRTDGGSLYGIFRNQGIVAIGYSEVSYEDVLKTDGDINKLTRLVSRKFPEHKRPGFVASQIHRFFFEMKPGDYVVIPSRSSDVLSIGTIQEKLVLNKDIKYVDRKGKKSKVEGYTKVRTVNWVKHVPKQFINPKLYKLFFSHQTVVDANKYSTLVNSMLYSFYKAEGEYHLVFEVSNEHVGALQLMKSYAEIITIANDIARKIGYDESADEVDVSVYLSSPGKLELYGKRSAITLMIVGALVIGINGGGFKMAAWGIDLSTEGFISKYNEYLNDEVDRQLKTELQNKIKALKINNPKEIEDLLKVVKTKDK